MLELVKSTWDDIREEIKNDRNGKALEQIE